jgi:hemolysin activation/secretion protein
MRLRAWAAIGSAVLAMAVANQAKAQTAPPQLPYGIGNAVREGEQTRRQPLPGSPAVPALPHLLEPQFTLKDKETMLVRHFKIEGPAIVSDLEIRTVLAPYEGRRLTIAQIYEATDQLTTIYRTHGYMVAKVYVPAQNARGGVLRLKVMPGQYGAVHLKNDSLVRDSIVQGVIDRARSRSPYIEKNSLERAMLLVSDLSGAGMPRIVIGPGQRPETTDFTFNAPQGKRVDGYLLADNFGSPYTGRDRLTGNIDINSPLGIGDRLSAFGIISDGGGLKNGRLGYSLPIGTDGLRAEVAAFRTTYVLGGQFAGLDATGTADGVLGTLTYALIRQSDKSLYVWGNFTHKALNDNILAASFADRSINLGSGGVTYDALGALWALPVTSSTTFSVTHGRVNFDDPLQKAQNIAGADTVGDYTKINLNHVSTLAFNEKWSLTTNFRAQKSFGKNLDSSEQLGLTGWFGIRSFDEGLAGDSGYIVTPELKYALPDFGRFKHSVGLFTDVGGVWLENPGFTTTQNAFTQLNDVGLGYYATFEYLPTRFLLLKAMVARTYGSDGGAQVYDRGTKGLVQIGATF